MLSLTQEGLFQEDGYEEDPTRGHEYPTGGPDTGGPEYPTGTEEGEVQTSPDEGVQFLMPGGSFLCEDGTTACDALPLNTPLHGNVSTSPLSSATPPSITSPYQVGNTSFWSVGTPPQCFAMPPQQRPQSSTLLREGVMPTSCNGTPFDRNRSMSYPRRHHRPNSAEAASQRRQTCRSVLEDKELMSESLDSGLAASSETSIASSDSAMQYSALGVSAVCIYQAVKAMLDHK